MATATSLNMQNPLIRSRAAWCRPERSDQVPRGAHPQEEIIPCREWFDDLEQVGQPEETGQLHREAHPVGSSDGRLRSGSG